MKTKFISILTAVTMLTSMASVYAEPTNNDSSPVLEPHTELEYTTLPTPTETPAISNIESEDEEKPDTSSENVEITPDSLIDEEMSEDNANEELSYDAEKEIPLDNEPLSEEDKFTVWEHREQRDALVNAAEEYETSQEEPPKPIKQNDVYFYPEEEVELDEDYEPIIHTERLPDDMQLSDEGMEVMSKSSMKKAKARLQTTASTSDIWSELFTEQFGDNYTAPYAKKAEGQRITGNTNRLTIEETDLKLEGKNGLDVMIKRRYDNQNYSNTYSAVRNYPDYTEQEKYIVGFKNTTTNAQINIAFYTEDDFYTYMYNGRRIMNISSISPVTKSVLYNHQLITLTYYNFSDLYSHLTNNTSYDLYVYDSSVTCKTIYEEIDSDITYSLKSQKLKNESSEIGYDWFLDMPELSLIETASRTYSGTNSKEYQWDYIGAFRDKDGNVQNIDGFVAYTIYKKKDNEFESYLRCDENLHLSITKFFEPEQLSEYSIQYNLQIVDNRGYTYYMYCPIGDNYTNPPNRQLFRVVAIQDTYGNTIRYTYNSDYTKLTKITDTYDREINISQGETETTITYAENGTNKTIKYALSTLSSSSLNNDSPIKQKPVKRFTVTNQLGEKTYYDSRETKVMNACHVSSVFNGYPSIGYEDERIASGYNIERIIYPTGAETRYTYKSIYPYAERTGVLHGVYAVVKNYDIVNNTIANYRTYSITEDSNVTITETNTSAQSKTVRNYNDKGLLTEEKTTPPNANTPYRRITYTYDSSNKPQQVVDSTEVLTKSMSYYYRQNYPDLLSSVSNGRCRINYIYKTNGSYYTDKPTTITYTPVNATGQSYTISLGYNANDSLSSEIVTQNNVVKSKTAYSYDSYGNLGSTTQWTGDTNGDGQLTTSDDVIESYASHIYTDTHTIGAFMLKILNADGTNTGSITDSYSLNMHGSPVSHTDPLGNVTQISYDSLNRPIQYTMPNGGTKTVVYNTVNNTITITDEAGIVYQNIYDGLGRLVQKKRAGDTLETYTYDAASRVITKTYGQSGAGKMKDVYTYDVINRVKTRAVYEYNSSNPLYTEYYTYANNNGTRLVTKYVISADGTQLADEITEYDNFGRVIEEGKTINYDDYRYVNNYFYDYMDRVIQCSNPRDKSTYYEYTYDGQISKQTDALSNETTFQYDLVGRNVSATDARGNTTVTDYDKMGRVIMVTAPFDNNNAITKTYYDKNSNVTKKSVRRTGTAYTTEEYTYDSMGNMLTSTSGSGTSASAVKYTYDTANRITSMTTGLSSAAASGGNTTTYTYDNKSYLWKVTDPLGNYEELINYDAYGNVGNKYDRYGNYFTYTYGPFGITLESAMGGGRKSYTYNSVGQLTNTTMTTAQNETASESYTYDEYGRMTSKTSADGTVQTYTHDENGNVLSYSEVKNNVVKSSKNYEYDNLDRLTKLSNNDNIFTYKYDANSNLTSITDTANKGANVSVTYNKANLPTVYSSTYGSNSYNYAVTYFVNGCKYIDVEQHTGNRTYYTYDTQNRLTNEYSHKSDGEEIYDYTYEYDAGGNRTKLTSYNDEISKKDVTQYTYDANNRMTQSQLMKNLSYSASSGTVNQTRTYTYDENGNMRKEVITGTGAKTKQYGYDEFNRLKSCSDGTTTATYMYGTDNLRAYKTVNGTKTTYVWDGMNLASETTSNVTTAYTHDMTGVVASKKGSYAIVNFIKDTHGNVVAMGSNHSVTGAYNYSAFGNQIESTNTLNPFRYCGEYYDNESGLIYLRNRYYDSETGRFITEDPIRDGVNWYVYGNNNPVKFVDPTGLGYDEVINALNNLYYDRGIMESSPSYTVEFQDAYSSALSAKNAIRNSDVYIEDWGGLSDTLGGIVNGDNNTTTKIKAIAQAVEIAKKNSERRDFLDGTIFTTVIASGITIAIRSGTNLMKIVGSLAHTVPLTTPVNENTLHHIFDKAQHNLTPFLEHFEYNQTEAYNAVRNAAQIYINNNNIADKIYNSTLNPLNINVNGFDIKVGGRVMDGIINISTFFIK